MEYYKKLQKLLEFNQLANRRIEQLKVEEKVDERLKRCYTTCPRAVFNYTMIMRQKNRDHTNDLHKSSCIDYAEKMNNMLSEIDEIQEKVLFRVYCENMCSMLPTD